MKESGPFPQLGAGGVAPPDKFSVGKSTNLPFLWAYYLLFCIFGTQEEEFGPAV